MAYIGIPRRTGLAGFEPTKSQSQVRYHIVIFGDHFNFYYDSNIKNYPFHSFSFIQIVPPEHMIPVQSPLEIESIPLKKNQSIRFRRASVIPNVRSKFSANGYLVFSNLQSY